MLADQDRRRTPRRSSSVVSKRRSAYRAQKTPVAPGHRIGNAIGLSRANGQSSETSPIFGSGSAFDRSIAPGKPKPHSAERCCVLDIARLSGVSRPAVWRWQRRYAEQGVGGLLRDKTRKPGKAPLPAETVAKVLALPCSEPLGNATHWTGRAVAKATGISLRAVQRIGKLIGFSRFVCARSRHPAVPPSFAFRE